MPNYLVETSSTSHTTRRVKADSPEEARERYSEGEVIHSETTLDAPDPSHIPALEE